MASKRKRRGNADPDEYEVARHRLPPVAKLPDVDVSDAPFHPPPEPK